MFYRSTLGLAALLVAVAAGAILPSAAIAQRARLAEGPATNVEAKILCKGEMAPSCTGTMTQQDSIQRYEFELQVQDTINEEAITDAVVRFHPTSGTLVGDSVRRVGPDGRVRAMWLRLQGKGTVGIGVDVRPAAGSPRSYSATGYLRLVPPEEASASLLRLKTTQTFPPAAFENTTLRRPMIVEIRKVAAPDDIVGTPITSDAECRKHRLVFRGTAGKMTPDTAVPGVYKARPFGTPESRNALGCRAEAEWSIAAGEGLRQARVDLVAGRGYEQVNQEPLRWDVRARLVPRFVLGAVIRGDEKYDAREDGDAVTYRVERTENGTKIAFDSIHPGTVTYKRSDRFSTGVMVGVSAPIPAGWTDWLTVVGGVDLTSPLDHQYLGLSVLRPFDVSDGLPLNVALLAHFGRADVLQRPGDCRAQISSVAGAEPCATEESRRLRGVGLLFSIDAGSLLAEAIKKLGT